MTTATYTITGMTCGHCVQAVRSGISAVAGVTAVEVDLGSGEARVTGDGPLDDPAVRAAVAEAGYSVAG
jgi:copper chaperone CopZ